MAAPALAAPYPGADGDLIRQVALIEDPTVFAGDVLMILAAQGSAEHAYLRRIATGETVPRHRDAHADLLHFLSILHGHHPSVAEVAAQTARNKLAPPVFDWLTAASLTFAREREWLAQLVVSAPPTPALAGLTAAEQIVRAQRDAMLTLAASDRAGCALGAAVALMIDWTHIRAAVAESQRHFLGRDGISPDWHSDVPSDGLTRAALEAAAGTVSTRRALLFGVMQMVTQHRALWDLLEARHARQR